MRNSVDEQIAPLQSSSRSFAKRRAPPGGQKPTSFWKKCEGLTNSSAIDLQRVADKSLIWLGQLQTNSSRLFIRAQHLRDRLQRLRMPWPPSSMCMTI